MKKIYGCLAGLFFSFSLFAQEKINDPNAEKREVKNFHSISVSNAFDVYLTQGNEEALAVSAAEKEYLEKIKTTVTNGVLRVSFDNRHNFLKGWRSDKKNLKVYISFDDIQNINVSGACNVTIVGSVKADKLKIDLSGASDLKGKLEVKDFTAVLSGASDMDVSGTVSATNIDVSGASEFKGFDLVADYCKAEASGASGVKLTVNKELSAKASGASDVAYKGSAKITGVKTGGASSVSKKS